MSTDQAHPDGAPSGLVPPPCCVRCGYNLTGLFGEVCPECGWRIDWRQVRAAIRIGTPASRARGWRMIDHTALTVAMLLVMPWRFARQIRHDEDWRPAAAVAFLSYAITYGLHLDDLLDCLLAALTIAVVIVAQSLTFATLQYGGAVMPVLWGQRFRLWLTISLYATCFVAAWNLTDPPVVGITGNVYIPFISQSGWFLKPAPGPTILFYWWWWTLGTVVIIRNRPRWLAVVATPLVWLFGWLGYVSYVTIGDLMGV